MGKILSTCLIVFISILATSSFSSAEILGDYVGYTACIKCHKEIVDGWKTTPHARAFEVLKEQGKEKQSAQGCVRCHVVGFEKDGGFIDMELTPELKDVQCEACHGPGRKHVQSEDADDIVGEPGEALCRTCHTKGQDKNFNYDMKKKWVHGGYSKLQAATKIIEKKGKEGKLKISQTKVDFGNMIEGVVARKVVTLSNVGDAPFKITNAAAS